MLYASFQEVFSPICRSITTYFSISLDAWIGDNVLDPKQPLDPSKTSIPELEDPDCEKIRKAIVEDT